jgi:hypothetical protein
MRPRSPPNLGRAARSARADRARPRAVSRQTSATAAFGVADGPAALVFAGYAGGGRDDAALYEDAVLPLLADHGADRYQDSPHATSAGIWGQT